MSPRSHCAEDESTRADWRPARRPVPWRRVALVCGLLLLPPGAAQAAAGSTTAEARAPSWAETLLDRIQSSSTVMQVLQGPNNPWDRTFARWERWKRDQHVPVTVGAYHWWHVNHGGPLATGYGVQGLRGTYYYYVDADPAVLVKGPAVSPFIRRIGAHIDFRWRDSDDKLRSFYRHTYWFYEGYAYADTPIGRFEGGVIRRHFGLDWDGSFWGNVQYFDGFKLNSDYGLAWERTWEVASRFKVESTVQYFLAQNRINGSIAGAEPESIEGSHVRNLGIVRIVPSWALSDRSSVALGFSVLGGEIRNDAGLGPNRGEAAWAVDLTYHFDHWKVFGELLQDYGRRSPQNYVTGGPSNRTTDLLAGLAYQLGPATFRFAWSAGFLANPGGSQFLYVPGMTLAISRNLDLDFEYVHWKTQDVSGRSSALLEDGFQLVLHWKL